MNWKPGLPVVTTQDHEEWRIWRNERKRQQQRERRALYPRIDYYPDSLAVQVIRDMTTNGPGGDLSSVLNRIVGEWAENCHRN